MYCCASIEQSISSSIISQQCGHCRWTLSSMLISVGYVPVNASPYGMTIAINAAGVTAGSAPLRPMGSNTNRKRKGVYMKFGIINGSHRTQSQSEKVSTYVAQEALAAGYCESVWRYDLAGNPLPLWDEGVFGGDTAWEHRLQPLSAALHECDAFVVVAPEWHGMVPAGLKNFFLMWAAGGELAHKPGLIVSVSASAGGAYPVAELRMSSYKNSRLCYIPEQLVVRNVKQVMNPEPSDNDAKAHDYLHQRLLYCLGQLREYGKALRTVRASGVTSLQDYPNGM